MLILEKNLKQGMIKIRVNNQEDLWHLSNIIEKGDRLNSFTYRKIKLGGEDKKTELMKKKVVLTIIAEKVELGQELRVSGIVADDIEDIPKGSHHTITLVLNSEAKITKDEWQKYHLDRINEACNEKPSKIIICVFDREEAYFALMKRQGYEILSSIKGEVEKKNYSQKSSDFFAEVSSMLLDYDKKYELDRIVLASPAFWKDEILKSIDNKLRPKIITATCSSATESAIQEVLKRDEVKEALQQERLVQESRLVEDLLREISKDNLACYGLKQVEDSLNRGAARALLITSNFIEKNKSLSSTLLKSAEGMQAKSTIINSQFEPGKKLDSLSGIAAILRYKF